MLHNSCEAAVSEALRAGHPKWAEPLNALNWLDAITASKQVKSDRLNISPLRRFLLKDIDSKESCV